MPDKKPPKREKVTTVRQSARHTLEIVHEGLDPTQQSVDAILEEGRAQLYQIAQDYSRENKPRPFRVSQRITRNEDGTVTVHSYISDAVATPLSEDVALKLKPFVLNRAKRNDTDRLVDKGGGPDGIKPAPPKAPPRPPRPKRPPATPPDEGASAQSPAIPDTLQSKPT